MKVSILTENLKRGVSIAIRGISTRTQLPILSTILILAGKDGLTLSTTDLELSFRVKVRAKVSEEGEIAVPGKLFSDLIATLPPGTIEMQAEKEALVLSGDSVKVEIMGQSASEFPSLPTASGKGLTIDIGEFSEKVERVGVAAARDESRPVLSGLLWALGGGALTLVATDGYRLGIDLLKKIAAGAMEDGQKFILPVKAVLELARVLETGMEALIVEFDQEKQQVIFGAGDVEMSSRLIAGEYPPYRSVIPTDKKMTVTLERESLIEAVRRASLFAADNANVVKFLIAEDGVTVTARSDQMGKSQTMLTAEVDGEGVTIAFNAKYLLDYLGSIDDERITMETEGMLKPVVFRQPASDFVHVIMPVRI